MWRRWRGGKVKAGASLPRIYTDRKPATETQSHGENSQDDLVAPDLREAAFFLNPLRSISVL
jgi:hypothetical protein